MLDVRGIHTYYGLSHILFGVSLKVEPGEVVCLLGRNGAGKTTTMRSIMGLVPSREGKIFFKGEDITGKEPYQIARMGIAYVPDDRRIFADLTVEENLEIAERRRDGDGWSRERVYELFPALKEIRDRRGGCLSGGEQKMLAIARALMTNPELLLLDEPTRGVDVGAKHEIYQLMNAWSKKGIAIVLITSEMPELLAMSDRIIVMHRGRITAEFSRDSATQEKILAAAMGEKVPA